MILSEAQRQFALSHRIAHLATADAVGIPHVIPICFALHADQFYSVIDDKPKRTHTGLKRLRNIVANGHVALVIDDYDDDDWSRLAFLRVQGNASLVADPEEYASALFLLRQRYRQYTTMPIALASHPMIRIVSVQAHFWRAASS